MKRNAFTLGVTIAVTLLCTTLVLAQSSANFALPWSAQSSGGQRGSASFIIQDEISPFAGGAAASANFGLHAGFPAGLESSPSANTTPTATPLPPPGRR